MTRFWRRLRLWQKIAAIAGGMFALWAFLGIGAVVFLLNSGLAGTSVTEKTLTHEQQIKILNEFLPVPVPPEASDIHVAYEKFQDWHFEGSFALPPAQIKAFAAHLTKANDTGLTPGREWYKGRKIGSYEGILSIDPAMRRVYIEHFSQ